MPPEPLPWARRDFFKERKRERSSESIGFVSRWRENPHQGREFLRSRPPGHAKQGGWHNFSQEPGHGFTPSRSNEKIFGDENCKPSGSRADGNSAGIAGKIEAPLVPEGLERSFLGEWFVGKWSWQTDSDQNNKTGSNGLGTGQILERENSMGSIDRKTLNWTCSGSLTSRGSDISHSSSSKSMGMDSSDATAELEKPCLGWDEGLAKYEKKKVEGPDDSATKNGMVVCVNTEPLHCNGSILSDKSLRFTFSDYASPGTPSSVGCSSSPDLIPIANLSSSLGELLQSDNPLDSSSESSTPMNKLLVWKGDVLKTLEMTESEIDLLENELKSLTSESRNSCPCLAGPSSSQRECQAKPFEDLVVNTGGSLRPAPLQLVSSGDMIAKEATGGLEEGRGQLKDEDIDSPSAVTSKFVEPHRSVNAAVMSESVKHGGSNLDLDASKPSNQEVTCSAYVSNGEKEECLSDCDSGGQLMARKSCTSPVGVSLHCAREDKLYYLILASNKVSASKASDVFNKLLPSDRCHVDLLRASSVSS
ncbi:Kinesin-like protein [Actinidia chinensis var. chinensis]|uniref:Kinesin-like protein n=1 Tax=Actinidia chinensis var. chinensis TaxID=1590841 RepID=A0A2R6PL01_ACTCC|nr:Kinesin-like protein [Actinidia chinensis var. chinensis]